MNAKRASIQCPSLRRGSPPCSPGGRQDCAPGDPQADSCSRPENCLRRAAGFCFRAAAQWGAAGAAGLGISPRTHAGLRIRGAATAHGVRPTTRACVRRLGGGVRAAFAATHRLPSNRRAPVATEPAGTLLSALGRRAVSERARARSDGPADGSFWSCRDFFKGIASVARH